MSICSNLSKSIGGFIIDAVSFKSYCLHVQQMRDQHQALLHYKSIEVHSLVRLHNSTVTMLCMFTDYSPKHC